MIDTTKVTDRRQLRFTSMQDIVDDVARLDEDTRTTGNWTAAQIVQHLAKMINYSIDGFPRRGSLPVRLLGRMMRKRALSAPLPAGYSFPRKFHFLTPDADVTLVTALRFMRETIGRLQLEKMTAPSPILGRLNPEQWEQMHCRHAEMHFSFMHPAQK